MDKLWSQISSLLPAGKCLRFYRAEGLAFPTLVDFHRTLRTRALALSANQLSLQAKVPIMTSTINSMHSGGLEPAKSTLVGYEVNPLDYRGHRPTTNRQLFLGGANYPLCCFLPIQSACRHKSSTSRDMPSSELVTSCKILPTQL